MVLKQQESTFEKQSLMSLVLAAQDGDRCAFEVLVERYQRGVYLTVLGRLRNEAEAQEMCQEVFIQAMRKIGQLRDPLAFGGWLRSIANRMAINRAVRTRPMARLDCELAEPRAVEQETPLEEVLAQEQREQVHTGLGRPLHQRPNSDAVVRRHHGPRSCREPWERLRGNQWRDRDPVEFNAIHRQPEVHPWHRQRGQQRHHDLVHGWREGAVAVG